MAAGTETAVDTRGNVSLVGNIVEKVLLARQLAENERKFAEKKAEEAGTSLEEAGIERGHFFKKALYGEFGGNYIDKKSKELKNVVKKYRIAKRITKDPKAAFRFIKPILKKDVSKAQTKMFRAKFDYTYSDNINRPEPQTPIVGSTAKKIQKATTGKRISREQLLTTLSDLVDSLNKTAESIGRNTSGLSSGIISATQAQHEIVEQLKERNTTLEDKLDKIAEAISSQTNFQKKSISKVRAVKQEQKLEQIKDFSDVEVPDDTETAVNETLVSQLSQNVTPTTNIINNQTIQQPAPRPLGGYPSISSIPKPGMDVPQYETGGIVSGPNTGYLAKVPKNTAVIPIKNNYTEGKPSAVDGKVRPIPQRETGTKASSVGGRLGFGITSMTGIAKGGTTQASALSQPLVDAMSLPMMVTGGSVLSTVSKLISSMGPEGASIAPELEKITRPIANVFGLPPTLASKAKGPTVAKAIKEEPEEEDDSKKNIISKLMDGFGALLDKLKDNINDRPPPPGGTNISSAPEDVKLAGFLSTLEGSGGQTAADTFQVMLNRAASNYSNYGQNLGAQIMAQGQFSPFAAAIYDRDTGDPAADTKYGAIRSKLGKTPQERIARLRQIASQPDGLDQLQTLFGAGSASEAKKVIEDFQTGGPLSQTARSGVRGAVSFRGYDPGVAGAFRRPQGGNTFFDFKSTVGMLSEVAPETKQPAVQPMSKITQNFGYKEGDRVNFEYNGKQYHAYRTNNDWAFFEGSKEIGPLATPISRSQGQNAKIAEHFTKLMSSQKSSAGLQASVNPPPGARKSAETQMLAQEIDSNGSNIVAMMMPGVKQPQTASTNLPSSVETATAGRGGNPLINSGLFSTDTMA